MKSITVLSSLATREAYLELVPAFEKSDGQQGHHHLGRNRRHQQADGRG